MCIHFPFSQLKTPEKNSLLSSGVLPPQFQFLIAMKPEFGESNISNAY